MASWRPHLSGRPGPAYLALAEAIAEAVAEGRLAVGDRLPPQRVLALDLGLSLSTVTRGYGEATRRGLLEGTVGRGSFVRRPGPGALAAFPVASLARPAEGPVDFANNLPCAGGAAAALADTLRALAGAPDLGACLDRAGEREAQRAATVAGAWLERQGLTRERRSLVFTNGAQQGLHVALMALTRPGDAILVEALSYPALLALAERLGLVAIPVALDGEGLRPEALAAACRASGARVLCCMPTLQTPTAATMGAERRAAIAEVARRYDLRVVEDDVFGFLPAPRPPPLAAFAPERTLYLTSASKCLAPGLRVGMLQAPDALADALRAAVALTTWMPPPLMLEIVLRWLEEGTAARLADEQRREAGARQTLARELLGGALAGASPAGFHLWLALPEYWSPEAFEAAASRAGVALRGAALFAVEPARRPRCVRLCLSHETSRDRVRLGLERVARLLGQRGEEAAFVV